MTTSSQPRKQRKRLFNAPMHKRQKIMSSLLDKALKKSYGRKSLPIRTGDKVEVLRGDFKGTKGKVAEVNLKGYRVMIDSVKRKKADGSEAMVPIHPSNIRITDALMTDKKRAKIVERSGGKVVITKEKPAEEKKPSKEADTGVKCQICSASFGTKKELSDHMGEKHKDYTQ